MPCVPTAPPPAERTVSTTLSTIGLFVFVMFAWSLNWVVMKLAAQDVSPL
jgi:hypothetical protein